ncbi:SH3 domain-containing protein [Vibrio alfacsensis]|uniref:SH3 domain-containing protein n=1 Tax=Vibrio alfacsensis TaxID=1074311 RepID=UPI0040686300
MTADSHTQSVQLINQQIDRYLNSEGRELFLNQMLVALESDNRNKFKGKDPDTYSWWKIRVQPNEWQEAEVFSPVAEEVDTTHMLEFMDVAYRSKATLNLRSKPSVEGGRLGTLEKGEVFNAVAKVANEPWLLVEQKGIIKGYVHRDYARSNMVNRSILSIQPNPLFSLPSGGHDAYPMMALIGNYTCRLLSYELTKNDDITQGSFRACRKQRKVWYIDVPLSRAPSSSI